jgi:hypothetical protein
MFEMVAIQFSYKDIMDVLYAKPEHDCTHFRIKKKSN